MMTHRTTSGTLAGEPAPCTPRLLPGLPCPEQRCTARDGFCRPQTPADCLAGEVFVEGRGCLPAGEGGGTDPGEDGGSGQQQKEGESVTLTELAPWVAGGLGVGLLYKWTQ